LSADFSDVETVQPDQGHDTPSTPAPPGEMANEGNEQGAMAGQSRRGVEERPDETAAAMATSEAYEQPATARSEQNELESNLEDPGDWVKRMLELKKDKQFEQLQIELDEFETAYPDHPLPPELADETR
jgi:hypothetical protein